MKWLILFSYYMFACAPLINAQEVFLLDIRQIKDSVIIDSTATLISSFNPNEKNNTPCFIGDSIFMLSANFPDQKQFDLWQVNLAQGTLTQWSSTSFDERYPTPDSYNKDRILLLRQVDSTQNALWFYPMDRSNQGNSIYTKEGEFINDFVQLSPEEYALTIRDHSPASSSPVAFKLLLYNSKEGQTFVLTKRVAPNCHQRDGVLYFIHKIISSTQYLKKRIPGSKKATIITTLPFQTEVFCLLDGEAFLAVSGTQLFLFQPEGRQGWVKMLDLAYLGIKEILSIDYFHNKLLLTARLADNAE